MHAVALAFTGIERVQNYGFSSQPMPPNDEDGKKGRSGQSGRKSRP